MRRMSILALSLLVATFCGFAQHTDTEQRKEDRLAWWREARFGMFIHWGPVSLQGTEISWSRGGARRGIEGKGEVPVNVYDSLYTRFDPVQFRADEWVSLARSAGMRYMVLTAKHCDGFCLWHAGADTYSIAHTPFRRDVCGELARAAHAAGMRIGWYYSPMDWRDPDCRTERNGAYVKRMQGHLRELLGNYGQIDLLWFDTDAGQAPWDQPATYNLVRSLQPVVIINNRLDMGSMDDYKAQKIGPEADYKTPEQRVGGFDDVQPWETCMTLGTQWSWKPGDTIKTSRECIRILAQCVTGDGNLLLNVGPMPDGRIEPRQAEVLREIGGWLEKFGESVYETRGGPLRNGAWGGSTRKGHTVYLHILRWDGDTLRLPSLAGRVLRGTALTGGDVRINQRDDATLVYLPVRERNDVDTVIKLEMEIAAAPR
jgi:alpha-L-fucosidase